MKAELAALKDPVKIANKSGMSEAAWAVHTRIKKMGISDKTSRIEGNLVKFEEEFLKQREKARQQKQLDDKRYQEAVQRFRQERLDNLKTNHEYMKDWEKNLTSLWKHSKVTMQEIKDAHIRFNGKMTDSIRKAEDNRSAAFRSDFENGIKNFEDNANRLGVELYHDPNNTHKVEKAPFNFHAMMQKVREKGELNEISRKQKESRERYIALKQARMREEVSKQNTLKSKLEKYMKYSELHKGDGGKVFVQQEKEKFLAGQRERQYNERTAKQTAHMEDIVKNLKTMSDEEYKKKNEDIKFLKQIHMFKEREKEYNYHMQICETVMMNIFELSDACFEKLPKDDHGDPLPYGQISNEIFKELLNRFINQETLYDEPPEQAELKSTILTYSKLTPNAASAVNIENVKDCYLQTTGSFKVPLTYDIFMEQKKEIDKTNPKLAELLLRFVDSVFPTKTKPTFPPDIPNLVPVRLSIVGKPLAGKKTLAKKLSGLLGVPIIDLDKIIEKAKSLVKPEENEEGNQDQDKKAAGAKKPPQGGKIPGKKDAVIQLTPEELELQKYGVKLKNLELLEKPIPIELKLELIILELKHLANLKKFSEVRQAFSEAKHKAEAKKEQKASNPKDDKKMDKVKSNPKMNPKEQETNKGEIEKEPAFEEQYPYTQGYILLGFPRTFEEAL